METDTRGISPLPSFHPAAAERPARLQPLRTALLAITTPTERMPYGDLGLNLADLIHDLRLDAEWKDLP